MTLFQVVEHGLDGAGFQDIVIGEHPAVGSFSKTDGPVVILIESALGLQSEVFQAGILRPIFPYNVSVLSVDAPSTTTISICSPAWETILLSVSSRNAARFNVAMQIDNLISP